MQMNDDQWISPSFNSYSQNQSAQIAAKVAGEAQSSFPTITEEEDNFEFPVMVPLKKLFSEEESSSSSSEADEMESIPPGSYCIWKPRLVSSFNSTCKKSKSTGFGSKRWKLRDLLHRSNSEGKGSFVFLTPKKKEEKSVISSNAAKAASSGSGSPARRLIYSPANRDIMRGNETPNRSPKGRKSYLPYRQDLVGFFTTVNSLGRNFSSRAMK